MISQSLYIITILIVFAGSMLQGLTGFGFAMIAIPLMAVLLDIKTAIPLGALCGLTINLLLFLRFKKAIDINEIKCLMIGALLGIPLGAFFLRSAPEVIIRILLATVIFSFSILSLAGVIGSRKINRKWGYFYGVFSGILGGAFNTNGPPVLIYSLLQGWDKDKLKSSLVGYFLFTSVIIVLTHISAGLVTLSIMVQYLELLPVVILGIAAGDWFFKKISSKLYGKLILFILMIISVILILK